MGAMPPHLWPPCWVVGSPWKAGWTAVVLKLSDFRTPLCSYNMGKPQGNFVDVGYIYQYVLY